MSLEAFTSQVRANAAAKPALKATIKFAFDEGGAIYIDGSGDANEVHNDDKPAQCTVKMKLENFGKLMGRTLDPMTAFVSGKLKVEGDMSVAMKLQKIFS